MKLFKNAKRGTRSTLIAEGNTSVGTCGPNFKVTFMLHNEGNNFTAELTTDQARQLSKDLSMYADIAERYKEEKMKHETIYSH